MSDASRDRTNADSFRHISRPAQTVDVDDLAAAFDRRNTRALQGLGNNSHFNGSSKYVNAMLTLLTCLSVAGIVGGISMYANVSALSVEVKYLKDEVQELKTAVARIK